jgi:trk system potassium uptake protein
MKILIIGCGRMGAGLALHLTRSGHTVMVVDNDPLAFERLGPGFPGMTEQGDALDRDVLIRAGIEGADALASLTPNDSINIVVSRLAREMFRVPKVIARMYDPRKAEIYRRLGVQTISIMMLGLQRLAESLTFSRLDIVHSLGTGEVGIVESDVPPLLVGRMVNDLTVAGEIRVIAITRDGRTLLPILGTVFQKDDVIHIALSTAAVGRLKTLMGFD